MPLQSREPSQQEENSSIAEGEPLYSEIPAEATAHIYENSGNTKTHYQELNGTEGKLTSLYAGLKHSDPHYENAVTQPTFSTFC